MKRIVALIFSILIAGSAFGQSVMRSNRLVNAAGNTLTLLPPTSLSNYSITLPGAVSTTGSMFYTSNGTGTLTWLAPGSTNNFLQMIGGIPTWQDPVTALQGDFVRYNLVGPQSLATTTGGNFLFNVEYGTTNAAPAAGARINSVTTAANSNATGLTLNATATGTGLATGLAVNVSGGTSPLAATFIGGGIGIGTSALGFSNVRTLEVFSPSVAGDHISNWQTLNFSPSVAELNRTIITQRSELLLNNTQPISGEVYAIDGGVTLQPAATTGTIATTTGVRGFAQNLNTTQTMGRAVGVQGHIQSAGPMTTASSFEASFISLGPLADLNEYKGLHVSFPSLGAGNITNFYAIDIDNQIFASGINAAFRYNSTSSPFIITGAGNVGIGSLTPSSQFDVTGRTVTANNLLPDGNWTPWIAQKTVQVVNPAASTAANYHTTMAYDSTAVIGNADMSSAVTIGRLARVKTLNTTTLNEIRVIQANVQNDGTGTLSSGSAFSANGLNTAGGTFSIMNGFDAYLQNSAGGTLSVARGLHIRSSIGGTAGISNFVGVQIDPVFQTGGGSGKYTNVTGINIDDIASTIITGTRRVLFYNGLIGNGNDPVAISGNGRLGIGTNAVSAPATSIDVDGGLTVRPPTTINVGAAGNITVGNRSYIRVTPTATVNVGLTAGSATGQILIVEVVPNGANALTFLDNAAQNENLQGNFTPPVATGGLLQLIWNGTLWMEISRTTP